MPTRKKCTAKKDGYSNSVCDTLLRTSKVFSKTSIGILRQSIANIKSGESLGVRFINVRERKDEGTVLNICPFCGGLLADVSQEEKEYMRDKYIALAGQ